MSVAVLREARGVCDALHSLATGTFAVLQLGERAGDYGRHPPPLRPKRRIFGAHYLDVPLVFVDTFVSDELRSARGGSLHREDANVDVDDVAL